MYQRQIFHGRPSHTTMLPRTLRCYLAHYDVAQRTKAPGALLGSTTQSAVEHQSPSGKSCASVDDNAPNNVLTAHQMAKNTPFRISHYPIPNPPITDQSSQFTQIPIFHIAQISEESAKNPKFLICHPNSHKSPPLSSSIERNLLPLPSSPFIVNTNLYFYLNLYFILPLQLSYYTPKSLTTFQ